MNDTSPVIRFLNQRGLAQRWGISVHTLERWRCYGKELHFVKFNNRVHYDIQDVEAYEAKHFANNTSKASLHTG